MKNTQGMLEDWKRRMEMTNEEKALEQIIMQKHDGEDCLIEFEVLEFLESALEENSKLKAEIEQLKSDFDTYYKLYLASIDARNILHECVDELKAELEQSVNKIKKKILSRRWVYTNVANPIEVLGMDWANKMNDWCIEIVEEAERSLKGKVEE